MMSFLFAAGFVAFILFFVIPWINKRQQETFKEYLPRLFPNDSFSIEKSENFFLNLLGVVQPRIIRDGLPLDIHFVRGGKNQPSYIYFYIPLRHRISLRLNTENVISGFVKSVGLLKEMQIGEAALDEALLVRSETENEARDLLMREDLRTILRSVCEDEKFAYLYLTPATRDSAAAQSGYTSVNPELVVGKRSSVDTKKWPGILIARVGTEKALKENPEVMRQMVDISFELAEMLRL